MSLDYSYKDIEWTQTLFNKSDECFTEGNIIIPDSMDDIAKIISIKAHPTVSDAKCENGRININGQIKISLIYIGENETGKIYTLNVPCPFSHTIVSNDITDEFLTLVTPVCCNVSHTIINTRRLKTTCALRFYASSYKNNRIKALSSAEGAQTICSEQNLYAARAICTKNIIITDNVEIGAGKNAITSILKHTVKITDKDFKVLNNKIIVKGNLNVSVLYCSEDSVNDAIVTLPFTEVIEAEGVSPSLTANVTLSVSDCEIRPDTDLSGEYKMLDINAVLSVNVRAFCQENIQTVTDIYLPGGALKSSFMPLKIQKDAASIAEEEFFKESITLPKGAPVISRVIDADCRIGEITLSDSAASATAEITFMYLSPSSSSLNTHTAKIPLAHKFNSDSVTNIIGEVNHIGYAITSDDTLEIRLSVIFTALCNNYEEINIITDCIEEEYIPPKRPSVIVSFVNRGDTLWSIAKKHNISLSSLATANAMDENAVLTVGEKLIIPR
ncbi:MAG: DUF3794 domain-containing protein [Clostridia bacterium]|nr:DUF3794 domain-containing protein [Clostridia bacterium]